VRDRLLSKGSSEVARGESMVFRAVLKIDMDPKLILF